MTQHSLCLIGRHSDLIKIQNGVDLDSWHVTHIKIVPHSSHLCKSLVSHSWQWLVFARHDSNHLFVKAKTGGEERGEEEKGGRLYACAQRRGVFPPSASGTISAKL